MAGVFAQRRLTGSTSGATRIPKSYAKGIAMTPDPWVECVGLEYGGDRCFAGSVSRQV